ncbi:MAG: isoprenylcysteine carboxylmethyltransferase family protein [Pseudomonadota bacterium]
MNTLRDIIDIPPVWTLLAMAGAYGIADVFPGFGSGTVAPGIAIMVVGFTIAIWAVVTLMNAQTSVMPRAKPSLLVRAGPYRYSRHPIYLADLVILGGWCVVTGQLATLLLIFPLGWLLYRRFAKPEEERLERRFGHGYRAWHAETPRWL